MDQDTENRIRHLAYELWEAADRPEGSSLRFWKEAELLIAAMDKVSLCGPATGTASDAHRQHKVDPQR